MSAPPPVSVIIVSRHRPAELALCLKALQLQDHMNFEVIVVADPAGLAVAEGLPVKRVAFDEANISAARNAGLAVAAGDLVAFIDDDAVAEPTWLGRLTQPFAVRQVAAAGGFVRGRDGLSLQWRARRVDIWGTHSDLVCDPEAPSLHSPAAGLAVRTEGTNAAFRRAVLAAIGGFDPAYRFYHDDADVSLRLAAEGHTTAVAPRAEVIHGFAASARRDAGRVPLDLREIGASSAVLWRRHATGRDPADAEARLVAEQRARALRHMVSGGIEPRDVARLMASLAEGLAEGARRALSDLTPIPAATEPFLAFPAGPRPGRLLAGRIWQAARLRRQAAGLALSEVVTLLLLWPGIRPHRMRFRPEGYWEQKGGLFGRAGRSSPRRFWTFGARVRQETDARHKTRPAPVTM